LNQVIEKTKGKISSKNLETKNWDDPDLAKVTICSELILSVQEVIRSEIHPINTAERMKRKMLADRASESCSLIGALL